VQVHSSQSELEVIAGELLLAPAHQIPRRMPPMRHERPPVERLGWQTRVVGSAIAILPLIFLLGCQALSQKQGAANPPPGQLTSNASTFAFGTVPVGANQSGSVVVTNAGGSPVTISQAKLSTAGFSLAGLNLPVVLNASQSTRFNLNFSPRSPGSISGNLSLVSDATNPNLDIGFSGIGIAPGQVTASPASLDFGSVLVRTTQTLPVTLANTGAAAVTISQASVAGNGLSIPGLALPLTLAIGQSTTFNVLFAPQAGGSTSGSVTLVSDGANPTLTLPVVGVAVTPGALVANPSSPVFGTVQVGSTKSLKETLTNSGGSAVTISQATVLGTGFTLTGAALPITLNAGQSVTFTLQFSPVSAGTVTGRFAIVSTATNANLTLPASGTGVTPGLLTANPTNQSFGNVTVGSSKSLSQTLTNSGGSSLTISNAVTIGSGFTLSGLALPLTLNPGQSTSFTLKFAPAAAGNASGTLTVSSNGSNTNLTVALGGAGILPPGTLGANPASLSFGSVQTGSSRTASETVTNSGPSSVTISQANVSGTGFNVSGLTLPVTLNVGQSTTFTVSFAPQSGGSVNGNLALISNGSNSTLNVVLSGTGVTPGLLTANPASQSFGNVATGSTKTLSQTLTNSGGSALTISQLSPSGTGFSFSGINPPVTLSAGQSFTFNVSFTPAASGSAAGSLAITSNGSNPNLTIALSATGVAPGLLTVNPGSINFGNVNVGSSLAQTGTLTASTGSVTVSSASITSSEFTLSGISLPLTIPAGSSASFTVTFAPQASGTASANLALVSNASNSTATQSLTGNGTAPVQHSVSLAWNASTSSNVTGYNIYRGTISGGPYTRINASLNPSTNDTDSSVQSGQTYYYVVTAVDSSANESSYSNEVQAIIP
jgi:hypothetical protein